MSLEDALRETGCAIFIDGQCTTSVEMLPDEKFLLMTRRGVCILQCKVTDNPDGIARQYPEQKRRPSRIQFTSTSEV